MESLNRIKLQATTEKKGVDNDATATCQDVFGAAAYACGCAGAEPVEPPADGTCGSVSQSPSAAYLFFHSYNIEIVIYLDMLPTKFCSRIPPYAHPCMRVALLGRI